MSKISLLQNKSKKYNRENPKYLYITEFNKNKVERGALMNTIKIFLFTFLFILIFTVFSNNVSSDMNAATPQAAAFRTVDAGSPAQGGDLLLPINVLSAPIPINIMYSSSDNTLRREATDVGFGFSLGAASAITRSVNGVPDDYIRVNDRHEKDCSGNNVITEETGWLFNRPGGTGPNFKYSERDYAGLFRPQCLTPPPVFSCLPYTESGCKTPSAIVSGCYWDWNDQFCRNRYDGDVYEPLWGVNRGNPDYFYVAVNGQGSSMILDTQDNDLDGNPDFVLSNVKPWKVSYSYDSSGNNGISEINIMTEDGTKYVFKDIGLKTSTTKTVCENDPAFFSLSLSDQTNYFVCGSGASFTESALNKQYTFAWPLVYILNNNYKDTNLNGIPDAGDSGGWAKFDYGLYGDTTSVNSESTISQGGYIARSNTLQGFRAVFENVFSVPEIVSSSTVTNYYLDKITNPLYEAKFNYQDRTSVYDSSKPNLKKLDSINLKQNPAVISNPPNLTTIQFTYATGTERLNNKLTLKEIREIGKNGVLSLPPTNFTYHGNCASGTENLYGLCSSDITAFLLKKINYPTGGSVEYTFESDSVNLLQNVAITPTDSPRFFNSGTRVKTIKSYDGTGHITQNDFSYGIGITETNPFCEKRYVNSATQSVYCPSENPNYIYNPSDIGRSYVNTVGYSTVWLTTSPFSDNGRIKTIYTTARDYPNVCGANGYCLTSLNYQNGREIIKTLEGAGADLLLQESYKTYTLDTADIPITREYSEWTGNSQHTYKITFVDWDHLGELNGLPVTPREVPYPQYDYYSFVSTGNFIKGEQVREKNWGDNPLEAAVIKAADYEYDANDIPKLGNQRPGTNFNGLPKLSREHLISNCVPFRNSDMSVPLPSISPSTIISYHCVPGKVRETDYTFGFQDTTGGLLTPKNMKTQPGKATVSDVLYDGLGTGSINLLSRQYVSESQALYATDLATNPDGSKNTQAAFQIYPASTSTWLDRDNSGKVTDSSERVLTEFLEYDSNGNVKKVRSPPNKNGFILDTYARYDTVFNAYPVKNWNSVLGSELDPLAEITYNEFGSPVTTTDFNRKITTYGYDELGRLVSVKKTDDLASSQIISYCYALDPNCDHTNSPTLNYVTTRNVLNPLVNIDSRSFADGQGKVMQTAVVESATSTIRINNEYYDNSKLKKTYLPFRDTQSPTAGSLNLYNTYKLQTTQITCSSRISKTCSVTSGSTTYLQSLSDICQDSKCNVQCRDYTIRCDGTNANCVGGTILNYNGGTCAQSHCSPFTQSRWLCGCSCTATPSSYFVIPQNIYVTSNPSGANIYLDGQDTLLITPTTLADVSIGSHAVRVVKEGYYDASQDITVNAGETVNVNFDLVLVPLKSTKFNYTKDPLLRLDTLTNADNTIIKNEYRVVTETETIPTTTCLQTNVKSCVATSNGNFISTGSLSYDDWKCANDPGGCQTFFFNNIQCSYSCVGTGSVECPATPVTGQMPCTTLIRAVYNSQSRGCFCDFNAFDTPISYYDAVSSPSSININKELFVAKTTDENGKFTESYTDRFGNLVKFIDADGKITKNEYDIQNRLIKVTNANNQITTNAYDTLGRLKQTTNPDFGTITYTYDDSGNKIQSTQNGVITTYEYDNANRLIRAVYPSPEQPVVYTYDTCIEGKGRLCSIDNGNIKKDFIYDPRGRITQETDYIWEHYYKYGTVFTKSYVYDSADNLRNITYPSNIRVDYNYNSLNQIDKITVNGQDTNINYNPEGTINSIQYPNTIVTNYFYDVMSRLTSFDIRSPSTSLLSEKLTYDNAGNILNIEELSSPLAIKPKSSFSYDNLYRLTKVFNSIDPTQPGKYFNAFNYTYDPLGNRQKENKVDYIYNTAPNTNKLAQTKNSPYNTLITDYTYDANGNLKTKVYNKEYSLSNIAAGASLLTLTLGDNTIALGTQIRIVYDLNKFDASVTNIVNKHYEWLANVESDANGNKIVKISTSKLDSISTRSDTDATFNTWYDSSKQLPNFKAYNPTRQTDVYVYDSQNRLTRIDFGETACSTYMYDESGNRIKKNENNQATIYINHGLNPIYERSDPENIACNSPLPPPTCTDTDLASYPTINYILQGTATSGIQSLTDSCIDSTSLREYYCLLSTSTTVSNQIQNCANGCTSGKCNDQPPPTSGGGSDITPCGGKKQPKCPKEIPG